MKYEKSACGRVFFGEKKGENMRKETEAANERTDFLKDTYGIFNAAFRGQFTNTPATGGAGL